MKIQLQNCQKGWIACEKLVSLVDVGDVLHVQDGVFRYKAQPAFVIGGFEVGVSCQGFPSDGEGVIHMNCIIIWQQMFAS